MRILYAIQGSGNGHILRAGEIIPVLKKKCETDILISNMKHDIAFPYEIQYNLKGLNYIFGKKGETDTWNTYIKRNIKRFKEEVEMLPVENYDLIINDFEPVSSWACMQKKVPCIALSHQSALLGKNVPKPLKKDNFSKFLLKNYAPSHKSIGLHFCHYSKNIHTPVINSDIRKLEIFEENYYMVYLSSFDNDKLITILSELKDTRWIVFSDYIKKRIDKDNVEIVSYKYDVFIKRLATCKGIICDAGFETPAEAMFLGKKLMVVPQKAEFEQYYNAGALKNLGIQVIKKLNKKYIPYIKEWIELDFKIQIEYPDMTNTIINQVLEIYLNDLLKTKLVKRKIKLKS